MKTTIATALAMALLIGACAADTDDEVTSVSDDSEVADAAETAAPASTTPSSTTTTTPSEATTTTTAAPVADDEDDGEPAASTGGFTLRDFRYCEILLTFTDDDGGEITEVWGTPGVDPCTDEAWYALDADEIQAETGASFVRMNGPRFFVVDGAVDTGDGAGTGVASGGEAVLEQFGDITMALLATTGATDESEPYRADIVDRTTTWTFAAGTEIYELTDADGAVYVMQSYSQIEDRSLTLADLPTLGERLALPDGWTYEVRVLDEPLQVALSADGAVVVQDEFNNSYQRNG